MRYSALKPVLALMLGIALSACNGSALFGKPNRILIVEASAADLATLVQSGIPEDRVLADSLNALRRRMELATGWPVTVEHTGARSVRIVVPDGALTRDTNRLTPLLKAGGKLEFRKVDTAADPAALADGLAPPGCDILDEPAGYGLMAVFKHGGVKDGHVKDAKQVFDDMTEEPVVAIRFDEVGKQQFAKLTTRSVDRPIAIVLDGRVLTAPIVREPITGGMVQIAGNMTIDDARQKADMIRAGYLPVSFTIVENKEAPRD
jgi:protein-export membrane protein SecD